MAEQPFDPSTRSVNHDRSGLWAPDPLDEFHIERRGPMAPAAPELQVEFVAPPASAAKNRHGLWFASGTVVGALICVILVSTLTTAPPPSEPWSAGGPAVSSSVPAPVSPAASEVLPAPRSIAVPDEPAVVAKASRPPTLNASRQAVPPVPVSSPRTQARNGLFVGSLRIDSTPQGARVFINRQAAGVTPLVVPKLGAGSHAVRVEADGYLSWSSAIRVIADRQNSVHAALPPLSTASIPR